MLNAIVHADYFLPIISDCTLIASKKLIQPFTYTERLLLLVVHDKLAPTLTDPTHHPKRHLDPVSHFAPVHFLNRQAVQRTDTWDRWQTCIKSAYALLYW